MDNHQVQCFYAVKEGAGAKPAAAAEDKKEEPAEQGESANVLAQIGRSRNSIKRNHFTAHVPTEETDLEIMEINAANGSWTANTCMLTKEHP